MLVLGGCWGCKCGLDIVVLLRSLWLDNYFGLNVKINVRYGFLVESLIFLYDLLLEIW